MGDGQIIHSLSNAEIRNFNHMIAVNHNIVRLDILMHQLLIMSLRQAIAQLYTVVDHLTDR